MTTTPHILSTLTRRSFLNTAGLLTLAAAFISTGCDLRNPFKPSPTKWKAEIERLSKPFVDAKLAPGFVVGIYDHGTTSIYGFGAISPTDPRTPDANTIYEIGSVSKVFTSLILADSTALGHFQLDDPISQFLPAAIHAPKKGESEITLRHLATHTSGLPRTPTNLNPASENPYAEYDRAKLYEFVNSFAPATTPGTSYTYSNLGMGLLGQLLADKYQTTYAALLAQRITEPLAMQDTFITPTPDQAARIAPGFSAEAPVGGMNFGSLAGCGGIRSTVSDLLKLAQAHIERGTSPLSAAIDIATTRQNLTDESGYPMALGWRYARNNRTLWHGGQTAGYSAALFIDPETHQAVVVLANAFDANFDLLANGIILTMFGAPQPALHLEPHAAVSPSNLDRLLGEYILDAARTIYITRENNLLIARLTGQSKWGASAKSDTVFFNKSLGVELEFEIESGKASSLYLTQFGHRLRCVRSK